MPDLQKNMTQDLSGDLVGREVETVDGELPEGLVELDAHSRKRQPARGAQEGWVIVCHVYDGHAARRVLDGTLGRCWVALGRKHFASHLGRTVWRMAGTAHLV